MKTLTQLVCYFSMADLKVRIALDWTTFFNKKFQWTTSTFNLNCSAFAVEYLIKGQNSLFML